MKEQNSATAADLVCAFFPGQGSQTVGMGKDLYDNFSYVREIFEEASDSIRIDLKRLCFDGPNAELTLTENTQPCLLTTSVAAYRVAERELNFAPRAVAGHSLGEYTALVASKYLDLATAVRWVRERGLAMQQAVPVGEGTMAAVLGLEDEVVERLCVSASASAQLKRKEPHPSSLSVPAVVEPANFNSPGQVVISGSLDAVQEAIQQVKTNPEWKGGKALPLSVSAPFHCQLMRPARDRMSEIFTKSTERQKVSRGICPLVPNRTARLMYEPSLVLELLMEQIDHPVLWKQSMVHLMEDQFTTFIEFGPGKVLSGLMKRISQGSAHPIHSYSVGDTSTYRALESAIKGV